MEWKVTYRAKGGARATDVFTATSREELFKILESRGLSAIRIEGCTDPKHNHVRLRRRSKASKVILLACIAISAIIAALVVLSSLSRQRENDEADNSSSRKITKSQPLAQKSNIHTPQTKSGVASSNVVGTVAADNISLDEKIVEVLSVATNADGAVIERFKTADGKVRSRQSAPRPIFQNPSDQIIALSVSGAAAGSEMPPVPSLDDSDEAFAKSLETDIEIKESDSADIKELKKSVIAVREEIRQLLSEGLSFADIIKDHRELVNRGAAIKDEASRIAKEFIDEGDRESALEFLTKANETLRDMGVDEIEMPLSREEKRALISERRNSK